MLVALIGGAWPRPLQAAGALDVSKASLAQVLRDYAQQSGLQLVYDQDTVAGKSARPLTGRPPTAVALDRILHGTGLAWRLVNESTVAIYRPRAVTAPRIPIAASAPAGNHYVPQEVSILADIDVVETQPWWTNPGTSSFGFGKPVLETPRSTTLISGEAIDVFGLTAVEDLLRVAPGVFTTTRFGVQGSVDIRGVPADTYFRGMKRLTLQGHGRSVLAAMDSIEIVGGAPSPLFGLGKIGGYANVIPKSGRARTGGYLAAPEGFAQVIAGSDDRRELSVGIGGPLDRTLTGGRDGGYYIYGLVEDSGSYADAVPVRQKILQVASSVNEVGAGFRLETGVNYQESSTAGALVGRLTQDLVDDYRYISGSPLVNLDLNGNGRIGYLEMVQASPVRGSLSTNNQPLNQVFAWPVDAKGRPLPLAQFPRVSGIPRTLYDYLVAHPEADPTGALRAQGAGGPVPLSGSVPVGMALDPRTVRFTQLDPRHSAAYERQIDARFMTLYVDLVRDDDPDRTAKNQFLFDGMEQVKSTNQPFSQVQDVYVLEDKVTLSRRLPAWGALRGINSLLSVNLRSTWSSGRQTFGDYGNHRSDAMDPTWSPTTAGMQPNTTFTSSNDVSTLADDGLPWGSVYRTVYTELGAGGMLDLDLPGQANLLLGARYDFTYARNTNEAGRFNFFTGKASNPGAFLTTADTARAWDGGYSWSASLSTEVAEGLRGYVTLARASIMLDGNNNSLLNPVIRAGHVGASRLREAGLKGSWRQGAVTAQLAAFDQGRIEVADADDPNVLAAYATSTTTRGWQGEVHWAPLRSVLLGAYVLAETTRYTPNFGGTIQVDARALGFTDVVDAQGRVVYPAEAFLYGGRARILLPANLPQYSRKQGNPPEQVGVTAIVQLAPRQGLTLKASYLSETCAGRLCLVRLPSSAVVDVGAFAGLGAFDLKLDVFNATDAHYFRARTGDTLGDVIAQAMPGRRWQITVRYTF